MRRLVLFALLLSATPPAAHAQAPATAADSAAVRATVQKYFDGMMRSDPALLRQAFDTSAALFGYVQARDGSFGLWRLPFGEWTAMFDPAKPIATGDRLALFQNRILSMDIAGSAAVVKTDLLWPRVHYVDYLSLLRIGTEWKVVNKIWWEERRQPQTAGR